MNIDPGLSVVISFIGFSWIFVKKIYPILTKRLDDHIESVKNKIQEAEDFKNEAYASLKNAYIKKDDTEELIKMNRLKSEEKIKRLQEENEKLLKMLRERHEASLKVQLEAEFAKQKSHLIEKLSDLVIKRLSERVVNANCKIVTNIEKNDLNKLLGMH